MKKPASRREFVRSSFRYALLAGLAAVSVVLVRKRGATLTNQDCISNGICRACSSVSKCGLPQALSFKQAIQTRRSS